MLFFLVLHLVALGFAMLYAIRARLVPAVAALVLLLYVTAGVALASVPPGIELPGIALLQLHWLAYPLLGTAIGTAVTWIGLRRSAGEWDGTETKRLAERAGFAGLGLTLLFAAMLVIVGLAQVVAGHDG